MVCRDFFFLEERILTDLLRSDPIAFFMIMVYRAPAVLIALTLHELAHGYVAYLCGDNTAREMGRLSFNPLKHLDLVGTILMFTAGMGWAKPVPVNPYRFRSPLRDDFLVSIAGVTVNFILFVVATLLSILIAQPLINDAYAAYYGYRFFLSFDENGFWYLLYTYGNEVADVLKTPWLIHVARFLFHFALCNLGQCLFNLLPFPPLDGFHVFNDILLKGRIRLSRQAFQYSMIALLFIMSGTDIVSNFLNIAIYGVQGGVLSVFMRLIGIS